MIYLDHAATTKMYPDVIELLTKSFEEDFANPSSSHRLGRDLNQKLNSLRSNFLKILGAKNDDHFYFTSSATESNNTVISGLDLLGDEVVLYSKADHKSVTEPIENLFHRKIKTISFDLLKNGQISIAHLQADSKVRLIVLSLVNNQSGNCYELKLLCDELKKLYPKSHLHIDAVQGFGKVDFQINNSIDSVSITSHKIGGPKGIAGLYLKKGHKVRPLLLGGGQQDNFRSSTESYPLAYAFYQAAQNSIKCIGNNYERVEKFNSEMKDFIKREVPSALFPFEGISPYILCFIIPKVPSDVLIRHLESKDVFIASTSACSSKIKGFNSTMAALGIEEKYHKNVLRISFGVTTTQEELNKFYEVFHAVWSDIAHLVK